MSIILGIDPGSRITGFGIIQLQGKQLQHVSSGSIHLTHKNLGQRLSHIYHSVRELMQRYSPDQVAIEQVFVHINPGGALKLGQARGAAIVGLTEHGLELAEYSARQIKQAVVGYGAAKKEQVQLMIRNLLRMTETPAADAADALAVAICHAHTAQHQAHLKQYQEEAS